MCFNNQQPHLRCTSWAMVLPLHEEIYGLGIMSIVVLYNLNGKISTFTSPTGLGFGSGLEQYIRLG